MVFEGTMVRAVKSVCDGQLMLYIYIYVYNPMLPPMYALYAERFLKLCEPLRREQNSLLSGQHVIFDGPAR